MQSFIYIYDEQKQIVGVKTNTKGEIINTKLRENYQTNSYQQLELKVIIQKI